MIPLTGRRLVKKANRGRDLASTEREILLAASKAWRFAPEMREIADTAEAVGLPGGFHLTAAEIFSRLADFKDCEKASLQEVIGVLPCAHDPSRNLSGSSHR